MSEFRHPQYGPPPAYGPPPQWTWPEASWPHGPGRPGLATAAGVLGYVTAGLTIVFSLLFLVISLGGDGDATTVVLVLGAPCAAGLLVGAGQTMRRDSARTLFASAAASVAVLVVALIVGVAVLPAGDLIAEAVFVVAALPLPVLTAIFARSRTVSEWVAAGGY